MASEWKRRYWAELRDYMQQEGIQLQAGSPGIGDRERIQPFEIGRRTFFLEAWIYTQRPEIGVRLRMSGKDGPAHFHLLKGQSEAISKEFGDIPNLKWSKYPRPDRHLNIVYVDKSNVDVTDETDWPNQHAWLASELERFNEIFRPRIMTLNAADYDPLGALDDVEDVDPAEEDIFDDFDDAEDIDRTEALAKAFEKQAEYVAPQSESNMPMHAYVVMLHLVSQGYSDFTEIRKVLCRESPGTYYTTLLEHIVRKIKVLEEEWGENIPPITALVFNTDGRAPKWSCEVLTGDGGVQPTAKQVAELATSVAAYDKWDKVLKALKPERLSQGAELKVEVKNAIRESYKEKPYATISKLCTQIEELQNLIEEEGWDGLTFEPKKLYCAFYLGRHPVFGVFLFNDPQFVVWMDEKDVEKLKGHYQFKYEPSRRHVYLQHTTIDTLHSIFEFAYRNMT